MSRWNRHSLDGLRDDACDPSVPIATMSSAPISAYGIPLGVTRKPVSIRALTLPALPRLMPRAFISIAVAMTASRNARESRMDTGVFGIHRGQPVRIAGEPALRQQAGDKACRRHVEGEIHGVGAGWRKCHARSVAIFVAAEHGQYFLG